MAANQSEFFFRTTLRLSGRRVSESKFIIGQPVEAQPSTTASKSEYDRSAAENLSTALARRCPWPTCVADKFRFQSDSEAEVHFRLHQNDFTESLERADQVQLAKLFLFKTL
jgi:hypothetical protein